MRVRTSWHHNFSLKLSCQETIIQSAPTIPQQSPPIPMKNGISKEHLKLQLFTRICHQSKKYIREPYSSTAPPTPFSAARPHHCIPECSSNNRWNLQLEVVMNRSSSAAIHVFFNRVEQDLSCIYIPVAMMVVCK